MKRLMALPLVLAALLLGASPAMAGPPEPASGHWSYQLDMDSLMWRYAGNTTFLTASEFSQFTGTFEGTAVDYFVVACHLKQTGMYDLAVHGTIDFEGAVAGQTGTMTLLFVGKQTSQVCAPSDAVWSGTWTVLEGTEGLSDLHGHGTWTGPSLELDYVGRIHFD